MSYNLEGQWKVTQSWQNVPAYHFDISINAQNVVTVLNSPEFQGLVRELNDGTVIMSISDKENNSLTLYEGHATFTMAAANFSGDAEGINSDRQPAYGQWVMSRPLDLNAPEGKHHVP